MDRSPNYQTPQGPNTASRAMEPPESPSPPAGGRHRPPPVVTRPVLLRSPRSHERLASSESSPEEPSPASTYGETDAGDSDVTTPCRPISAGEGSTLGSFSFIRSVNNNENAPFTKRESRNLERLGAPVPFKLPFESSMHSNHVTLRSGSGSSPAALASMIGRSRVSSRSDAKSSELAEDARTSEKSCDPSSTSTVSDFGMSDTLGADDADHIGMITIENAQGVYPPEACVFVANLPKMRSDEQIARILEEEFARFGTVYVKVRRDDRNLPCAFLQYQNEEDARSATVEGKKVVVFGRQCRTEKARCQRALYCSKRDASLLAVGDKLAITSILELYGIEEQWCPTQTEKEMYGLPDGIWIRFRLFGKCQEACKALRADGTYRFDLLREKRHQRSMGGLYPQRAEHKHDIFGPLSSPGSSIHVSNLAPSATEAKLHGIFRVYGMISGLKLIRKHWDHSPYAFIHFYDSAAAHKAVQYGAGGNFVMADRNTGVLYPVSIALAHQGTHTPVHGPAAHLGPKRSFNNMVWPSFVPEYVWSGNHPGYAPRFHPMLATDSYPGLNGNLARAQFSNTIPRNHFMQPGPSIEFGMIGGLAPVDGSGPLLPVSWETPVNGSYTAGHLETTHWAQNADGIVVPRCSESEECKPSAVTRHTTD